MRKITHNLSKQLKVAMVFTLSAAILLTISGCKKEPTPVTDGEDTSNEVTNATIALDATYDVPVEEQNLSLEIGEDLVLLDAGKYTGIYMEDGSNEVVTNIMMVILQNNNDRDLQLARIDVVYPDYTAEFEVTNLPAGQKVVLLEKNRHEAVASEPLSASLRNVAFFQQNMSICSDRVKLTGDRNTIQIENLTDKTFGEVYVYYKNSAVDLLYGGITYRTRLEAGLEPGEIGTAMSGHYNPDTCTIVNVQIQEFVPET